MDNKFTMKKSILILFACFGFNGFAQNIVNTSYDDVVQFSIVYNYEQHSVLGIQSDITNVWNSIFVNLNPEEEDDNMIFLNFNENTYKFKVVDLNMTETYPREYKFYFKEGWMYLLEEMKTCIFQFKNGMMIWMNYKN